jgi:hypothetical protein
MPAAYDPTSRRFDELMAEVCQQPREKIGRRIDEVQVRWACEATLAELKRRREIVLIERKLRGEIVIVTRDAC